MVSQPKGEPGPVIRVVRVSDVASLQSNCFSATSLGDVAAMVRSALEKAEVDEGVSLVAVADGEVLGNVTVTRNAHRLQRHRAHLGGFILNPRLRGTGTARHLAAEAARWARRQGCEILELDCRGGTHAEAAYRGLGFREWGRLPAGFVEDAGTFDQVCFYLEIEPWLTSTEQHGQAEPDRYSDVIRLGRRAVSTYQAAGTPVVAWLQGSAARALTPPADLDVVMIWDGLVPPAHLRASWRYSDRDFHLDRTTLEGQPVEVLHRTVEDVERLVSALEEGNHRAAGVLEPLPAAAGIVDAQHLVGDAALLAAWTARLTPVPDTLVAALCATARGDATRRLAELARSAERADHFAFEAQLVAALNEQVLPALFAAHGGYYPGRKWTARLLAQLSPATDLIDACHVVTRPTEAHHRLRSIRLLYEWISTWSHTQ